MSELCMGEGGGGGKVQRSSKVKSHADMRVRHIALVDRPFTGPGSGCLSPLNPRKSGKLSLYYNN